MISQVDSEGHHYQVSTKVTDHNINDSDITNVDGLIKSSNGNLHWKIMTRGWKILVEWKNDSVDWVPLKDLNQSNSVELAEYAMANEISDEPDFSWLVKDNLSCRYRIISRIKSKYCCTSYKFGIRTPQN